MTAPGNSVILLVLLTAFVGCVGYAVGRLHERHQNGAEMEEAYRDGYDQAARSTFSLAARVAGRKRRGAVRGSAAVSGSPSPAPAPPASPAAPEADPPDPAPPVVEPLPSAGPFPPVDSRRRAAGGVKPSFGFPAPPPQPVPGIPVPPAAGGVHYSSLPDPRWSSSPPDPPVQSVTQPVPHSSLPAQRSSRARHYAESDSLTGDLAPVSEVADSSGRHTVPDELVNSATYKLAADRVARAKVPEDPSRTPSDLPPDPSPAKLNSSPMSASPADANGRPPVPRPRGL